MAFCLENKLNWLYIDINSYFATIEQQVNPALRNKPVAILPVLSDSTCAIAASHEAKLKGISTGTKIYEAKKLCPDLICIKARHELYIEYHHRIFQEIESHLHVDHIFSIDEGACRLTGRYCMEDEVLSIAGLIKQGIKNNVGDYITCSIGIAPNRYLAKIASGMQKRDGLSVINPSELPQKLYALNLKSLPGVGKRTHEKLTAVGISTIEQLCNLDRARLKASWGSIWGEKVWYLIRGADLLLDKVRNSTIGQSQIPAPELQGIECARDILVNLSLKAASRLRSKNLYTSNIILAIDLKSGKPIKQSIKIELSNDSSIILKYILRAWDSIIQLGKIKKVRKISIGFYNLQVASNQLTFLNLEAQKKRQKLSQVIDYLNKKLGINIVSIGTIPKSHEAKPIVAFGHIPELHKK